MLLLHIEIRLEQPHKYRFIAIGRCVCVRVVVLAHTEFDNIVD